MLKTKANSITDSCGNRIFLRGVNLGGWFMMEGYILHGRNIPERVFKAEMEKHCDREALDDFTRSYRNNFITEEDFKNIARLKFNCIRLPFNHKLIENQTKKFSINKEGIDFLKKVISWCRKYNIYCILDMHAAPGSQNEDWHSDSDGKALLWSNKRYWERYFRLWEVLAESFKDSDIVAGYDVLNEPVIKKNARNILRPFYKEAVRRIRAIDKNHIIFLEGNFWSQRLEDIGEPFSNNLSYSIHYYHPLDFTFNFHRDLKYPGKINGKYWDIDRLRQGLETYYTYSKKWRIPIFVGEFGVNSRCGERAGELIWVKDVIKTFKDFGFHWTYWTYKAVANSVFPDGIYQYTRNPAWVRREGPVYGWENLYKLWKDHKREIVNSWQTKNFIENKQLRNLLVNYKPI
jgi:aryl-phospho-beta-D-glucosidase BglC (GH1 family)